jgi:hypothetical protein
MYASVLIGFRQRKNLIRFEIVEGLHDPTGPPDLQEVHLGILP